MKDFINLYSKLNEEQRKSIFDDELKKRADAIVFFEKLFTNEQFYEKVQQAIAEAVYDEFQKN